MGLKAPLVIPSCRDLYSKGENGVHEYDPDHRIRPDHSGSRFRPLAGVLCLAQSEDEVVQPIIVKLASKDAVTAAEIRTLAKVPSLRHALLRILESYDQPELFPKDYFTHEKGAECFLVNWLEYPTELGRAPDEIELFSKVTLEGNEFLDYYVFKYKTTTPHWAAQYDWMMGVSGPYRKESLPYDVPLRVFSRFKTLNSVTPESEAQWVHENISK
jgi:hypothetical protein